MVFNRHNPNESSYKPKLVLRCLALFLVTIAIIPAGYSWRISIFLLPILIMSWIWNLINVIKRIRSEYPVHPAANLACDLLLHILFIILGGLTIVVAVFCNKITAQNWKSNAIFANRWGNMEVCKTTTKAVSDDDDDEDEDKAGPSKTCTVPDDQIQLVRKLAKASLAACGFAMIVMFIHFVSFVWACVDTHRRRKERKEAISAFQAKQNEFSTQQE